MKFIYYLEFLVFRVIAFLVNLLPMGAADSFANGSGWLLFHLVPSRKWIALQNLKLAFKDEKSDVELHQIAIQSMQNVVKLAFEIIRIPQFVKNPERYFKSSGKEHVQNALKENKGLVFLISHFGNWELSAMSGLACGNPIHSVARPLKNPFVYDYLKKIRQMENVYSIDKGGAVRDVMKLVKEKKVIAILIDQHERQGAAWVDFFGRPAATSTFVAMLAHRFDVPVVPVFIHREKIGSYTIEAGKPFPIIKSENYDQDLFKNTQQYLKNLEDEIRKAPSDWLWMHRRWRDKPKEVKELAEKS